MKLSVLPLFLLPALLVSCSGDRDYRDIRDFYFPLKDLRDGLVYEYEPVGDDSLSSNYWYYRSFIFKDSVFLTGTYYEYELLPLQFIREELVDNGMLLEEMYLYEADSTGEQIRIPVEVEVGNAFPFMVRDSGGIFLYKVSWSSPLDPGATVRVIKNRRFTGDTTYRYRGATYDAVTFAVRELFEYDREGVLAQQYDGIEIYAEDLGLVYYRKDVNPQFILEYRLKGRYPMNELEEKFMKMYHPEVE